MTWSIRAPSIVGLATLGLLVAGVGVWGACSSLAGAVVALGQVQVEARAQIVQHRDGGVVSAILVRDGDRVKAGDPLLVLDDSELASQAAIVGGQIDELGARAARLAAERTGADRIIFPEALLAAAETDPRVAGIVAGQAALFAARLRTLSDAAGSYAEQKRQIDNEIAGQRAQITALAEQLALLGDELESAETLLRKGLAQSSRVFALKRENARLAGLRGELEAAVARNRGRIAQTGIEIAGLTAKRREEAVTELRDVEARIAELTEGKHAVETKLARLTLVAPMDGVVHDLRVHSIGAVIRPADPVLYIVPQEEDLTIVAHIDAYQIDSLYAGQPAVLRFTAFNARTTPEIAGTVVRVSADLSTDERTGARFYTAELRARRDQIARLGDKRLLPGMPVEVFIQTGERSPLSYVAKPFTDYFERAFRE